MSKTHSWEVTYLDNGKRKKMRTQAESAIAARHQLQQAGHAVVRVIPQKQRQIKRFALGLFLQELVALLEAGLVVTEAIETLRACSTDEQVLEMLERLLEKLYAGCQLSQAMSAQPEIFPPLLANTVASSEQTGHLANALKRYHYYEQRIEQLRKRIRGTLTYPVIVLSVGGLIICFLLGFIVPSFSQVFEGMNTLTDSARLILWWGNLVKHSGQELLLALAACLAFFFLLFRQPVVKQTLFSLVLKIPQLRQQQFLGILVRFYRTLGLLIEGGVPVPHALRLAKAVLPASHHQRLNRVLEHVLAGNTLSESLESQQLTTPVAMRLIQVGERSGELAGMCERIAAFYDEALERAIDSFTRIFEPVLMMIVGGIVGLVVFLLYMPIFEMAGSMS
ncbi:type II secretion system protein [Kosakonia radicincitans]|uniref:type II secretion system F family protein n=1 Tax=Kosakonia TaxID=1330547 RepID=UPI00090342DC|nr:MULTISPECIES: type II secretion system F family protein [Kosakonia]APG16834.1 type II secretion system protein [Kosakonia radicincitans]PTA93782.1 type II secretion system F family protein [Kosakonia sp. H7A]